MKVLNYLDLSKFSNWQVGGKARFFLEVNSVSELIQAKEFALSNSLRYLIVGNTSNLLFSDGLINVVLIRLSGDFHTITREDKTLTVGGAVNCQKLTRFCLRNNLGGIEHIVGVPATMGGLVCMNGGSNRKTISSNIMTVLSLSKDNTVIERDVSECKFNYRDSIYQHTDEIILSVTLCLATVKKEKSRKMCIDILKSRRLKFPKNLPSCGSVFVSNPKMYESFGPPGKIIEALGLKGLKKGGAQISEMHANFIVNIDNASADDVLFLVDLIFIRAKEKFGLELKSEALYVNNDGRLTSLTGNNHG